MPSGRQWCAFARHVSVLMISVGALCAQDPFEIHVLEYEQLQPGAFTFENHMNYVGHGTAASTQNVFHDTYELTVGVMKVVSQSRVRSNDSQRAGVSTVVFFRQRCRISAR